MRVGEALFGPVPDPSNTEKELIRIEREGRERRLGMTVAGVARGYSNYLDAMRIARQLVDEGKPEVAELTYWLVINHTERLIGLAAIDGYAHQDVIDAIHAEAISESGLGNSDEAQV